MYYMICTLIPGNRNSSTRLALRPLQYSLTLRTNGLGFCYSICYQARTDQAALVILHYEIKKNASAASGMLSWHTDQVHDVRSQERAIATSSFVYDCLPTSVSCFSSCTGAPSGRYQHMGSTSSTCADLQS